MLEYLFVVMEEKNKTNENQTNFRKDQVIVYTTNSCPYCVALKNFFQENNVDFKEVDITQDEELKKKIVEETGKREVPITKIEGETIIGFDKEKISQLLNIKG